MTFEENPFRVLGVSIYDTKATIIERADDLSFTDPDREKIFNQARDILINPRKRIAAEFWELVGDEIISTVDRSADIINLNKKFSELDAEKICWQINAVRKKSKFPAVQDTNAIRDELKNLRDEIREKLQNVLKNFPHYYCVKRANKFAEDTKYLANDGEFFGVIVEDFFDSYRLQMNPFFDATTEQIISLLNKIKINAHAKFTTELATKIKAFADARRPLDKFSIALGTNDFDAIEEIFYAVRSVAIDLHNEKHFINDPLILMRMLEQNFYYLPKLAELIRKDIKFLEEAKARQPTKSFLHAKAELEAIPAAIKRHLHFEKGFEGLNEAFYSYQFKPIYERTLQKLMIQSKYKPDEWQYLSSIAAAIYIRVGTAMTWALRADLAFEMFQKALPHATASGEAELISLARKRVDEWRDVSQKIEARSDDEADNYVWFFFIAIALVVYFLTH